MVIYPAASHPVSRFARYASGLLRAAPHGIKALFRSAYGRSRICTDEELILGGKARASRHKYTTIAQRVQSFPLPATAYRQTVPADRQHGDADPEQACRSG